MPPESCDRLGGVVLLCGDNETGHALQTESALPDGQPEEANCTKSQHIKANKRSNQKTRCLVSASSQRVPTSYKPTAMKSFTFPSLSMCQNCHGRNIRPGRRARRERRETAMAGGQTQSDLLGHDSLIDGEWIESMTQLGDRNENEKTSLFVAKRVLFGLVVVTVVFVVRKVG